MIRPNFIELSNQTAPVHKFNLKSKVVVALGLILLGVLIVAFLVQSRSPVKTVPLQLGGHTATHIGYQFSYDTRISGRIASKPHSISAYLVADGNKTRIPATHCNLVLTHNFPMIWIPRPSVPVFQHEVRLVRKKLFQFGQFRIPLGSPTEIWSTGPRTNLDAGRSIIPPNMKANRSENFVPTGGSVAIAMKPFAVALALFVEAEFDGTGFFVGKNASNRKRLAADAAEFVTPTVDDRVAMRAASLGLSGYTASKEFGLGVRDRILEITNLANNCTHAFKTRGGRECCITFV